MEQKKKFVFRKEWKWAYVFIAPMVLGTLIFGIIPIFFSIGLSLTNWDGLGEITFTGLDNFKKIFTEVFGGESDGKRAVCVKIFTLK